MKKITLFVCALATTLLSTSIHAQSESEMKAWMDYMTPGEAHKMMASWNGDWNGEITMWMAPGAPPEKSTGTCTNKMIMGGRYQVGTFSGSFSGMPFEGQSTLAYDNAKKKFISTWIDNMGTGVMILEGTWNPSSKTLTTKGSCVDPMTGKDISVREVFTVVDDKTQKMEMFMTAAGGKEFKSMEILFTRK